MPSCCFGRATIKAVVDNSFSGAVDFEIPGNDSLCRYGSLARIHPSANSNGLSWRDANFQVSLGDRSEGSSQIQVLNSYEDTACVRGKRKMQQNEYLNRMMVDENADISFLDRRSNRPARPNYFFCRSPLREKNTRAKVLIGEFKLG